MVWKSIVMFYYFLKYVKRRFNLSHVTKVSAQTFARGCKKRIQLGKTLLRILDAINRKYFILILKMTILINCTGKFCYRHGNFQNTEAATEGFLKNFTKFIGKCVCQSMRMQIH